MNEYNRPFTLAEAATYLSIAQGTLYNLVHSKRITCYKPSGKLLFFYRADLDAFVQRGQKLADFEVIKKAEGILNE